MILFRAETLPAGSLPGLFFGRGSGLLVALWFCCFFGRLVKKKRQPFEPPFLLALEERESAS